MTIVKKLLIVASMALGLQLNSLAYFSATALKTEVTSILNFIDVLDKEETPHARKAAELLNKEFRAEDKYEWNRYTLEDIDVIDMARIIEMNSSTDTKIEEILALFARQEFAQKLHIQNEEQRRRKEWITGLLALGATVTGYAAFCYYGLPFAQQVGSNLANAKS
jgi:hypothetical protein